MDLRRDVSIILDLLLEDLDLLLDDLDLLHSAQEMRMRRSADLSIAIK